MTAFVLKASGSMAKPDELDRHRPIFHLNAAWMLVLGLVMLRAGLRASS